MSCVRDAVGHRGLQRGSCQTPQSPRAALQGPTASSCNAQPWSCSREKATPAASPQSLWDQQLAPGTRGVTARGRLDLGAAGHSSAIATQAGANTNRPHQLPMALCGLKAGICHPARAAVGAQSLQGSTSTSITLGRWARGWGSFQAGCKHRAGCTRGWFPGGTLVSPLTFPRANFTDKRGSQSPGPPH